MLMCIWDSAVFPVRQINKPQQRADLMCAAQSNPFRRIVKKGKPALRRALAFIGIAVQGNGQGVLQQQFSHAWVEVTWAFYQHCCGFFTFYDPLDQPGASWAVVAHAYDTNCHFFMPFKAVAQVQRA